MSVTNVKNLISTEVFFHLNDEDMRVTIQVNKDWNKLTPNAVLFKISNCVNFFLAHLGKSLPMDQRKELSSICEASSRQFETLQNLNEANSVVFQSTQSILDVLKKVNFSSLAGISIDNSLTKKIVFLLQKRDFCLDTLPNELCFVHQRFEATTIELAQQRSTDEAIHFAGTIEDKPTQNRALNSICRVLGEQEKYSAAMKLANAITDEDTRDKMIVNVCIVFIKNGYFDDAIDLASSIYNKTFKDCAIINFSKALREMGNMEKAIEVAKGHSNGLALARISEALRETEDMEKSIEVAKEIQSEVFQAWEFRHICEAFIEINDLEKATEVASLIKVQKIKDGVFEKIETARSKLEG